MSFDPRQYARQVLIRYAQERSEQCGSDTAQARELGAAFREVGRELATSVEAMRVHREA